MKSKYRILNKKASRLGNRCKNNTRSGIIMMILMMLICQTSCKKLVEVNPPITSVNGANVFREDASAIAVLTGIYSSMSNHNFGFQAPLITMSLLPALSADELAVAGNYSPVFNSYYQNNLNSSGLSVNDYWSNIYPTIFVANSAIEGLNSSVTLTPAVRKQLLGEAEFIRAFCYFYLVNLYGEVPLAIGTDYKVNNSLPRAPKAQVYQQIIADLKDAQSKLSVNYLDASLMNTSTERVRPSYWSATALLARVYLYDGNLTQDAGNYANALTQSSLLINNSNLFSLGTLNNTFLKASSGNNEAIWQLQPVSIGDTPEARFFVLPPSGPSSSFPVYLSSQLVNSFEAGDQRKTNWVGSVTVPVNGVPTTYYYPYKYKVNNSSAPVTEYETVLRLGEQFLIRAEAEAEGAGNGLTDAVKDINVIRNRAGLGNYNGATDKASVLAAIVHERQVELFTEWGHRWLDLKRTGTVDAVMSVVTPLKGGTWNTNWQLYPILLDELNRNRNLTQNPGY